MGVNVKRSSYYSTSCGSALARSVVILQSQRGCDFGRRITNVAPSFVGSRRYRRRGLLRSSSLWKAPDRIPLPKRIERAHLSGSAQRFYRLPLGFRRRCPGRKGSRRFPRQKVQSKPSRRSNPESLMDVFDCVVNRFLWPASTLHSALLAVLRRQRHSTFMWKPADVSLSFARKATV